jgi:hypothetical protein
VASEVIDDGRQLLRQVADRATTKSFKQTINAAILLRAARPPSKATDKPRKARRIRAFLGIAGLLVSQHAESLWVLLHHH